MYLVIAALVGGAFLGNEYFKYEIGPIDILSIMIVCTLLYYMYSLISKGSEWLRERHETIEDKFLFGFFVVGIISVFLSYLGFYKTLIGLDDLLYNQDYIPRQAYYLFFIPLILCLSKASSESRMLNWVFAHNRFLFLALYCSFVIARGSLELNVGMTFLLGTVLLLGSRKINVIDVMLLLILVLSPVGTGGEQTQILMRIIAVMSFFVQSGKIIKTGIAIMLTIVLVCYIIPFLPLEQFGFDVNTIWRAEYWRDELLQLGESKGVGVGFGTSYATLGFVGEALSGPFAATGEYSTMERLFIVGCHNSFVSIAFRLGLIGIACLIMYFWSIRNTANEIHPKYIKSVTFALFSSMIVICFNVGFESPTYFFLFIFAAIWQKKAKILV